MKTFLTYQNMSKCYDLGSIDPCTIQPQGGNTYEITIKENDRIIVKVETRHPKISPRTLLSPLGISLEQTDQGLMYNKVEWSIKDDKPGEMGF